LKQEEFISVFCERPQNFAWFLGAGASRTAGLPTATDVIWDLKRRHYCQEENQDISRQDIQSDAVRSRIQSFMDSRCFPPIWSPEEYPTYFEKIFGSNLERQRKYLRAILSEENVSLAVGNRVFGALLSAGLTRISFTTNFDSVIEKAVAEVAGKSLSAFHLEGSKAANAALNNEEFPILCKLHGDFRYESLKNLPADLQAQDEELAKCFVNASSRFGMVVAGYSGRDESIAKLFEQALSAANPFPHGLYWTELSSTPVSPRVETLLKEAKNKGVRASVVRIETFDSLMLRLWKNLPKKPAGLEEKVRKTKFSPANIPLQKMGDGTAIIRINALPIIAKPKRCTTLRFASAIDWDDLRAARQRSENSIILMKADEVLGWGRKEDFERSFDKAIVSLDTRDLPQDLAHASNLSIKRFVEDAVCLALVKGKPLLTRTTGKGAFIIVDAHAEDVGPLEILQSRVGKPYGLVNGILTEPTEKHPTPEKVYWAEAARISVDSKNGQDWLIVDPDIWIWPNRARHLAREFLDQRRKDRFNQKYNGILDAWIQLLLASDDRATPVKLSAFESGDEIQNPTFTIFSRSGFSRRLQS